MGKMLFFLLPVGQLMLGGCEPLAFNY